MNVKNSVLLALAASAMIFTTSIALAEKPADKGGAPATQPSDKGEKKKSPDLKEALDQLGLSEDQKTKIAAIQADFKKQAEAWDASHEAEIKELKGKVEAAKKAKDDAQLKQLETQKGDLMKSRPNPKKSVDDIKAVLTADQKTKLESILNPGKKGENPADKGEKGAKHEHKPGDKDHKH